MSSLQTQPGSWAESANQPIWCWLYLGCTWLAWVGLALHPDWLGPPRPTGPGCKSAQSQRRVHHCCLMGSYKFTLLVQFKHLMSAMTSCLPMQSDDSQPTSQIESRQLFMSKYFGSWTQNTVFLYCSFTFVLTINLISKYFKMYKIFVN